MIDIHSHILPDVDDGSKSMEMSINMAKTYKENGYKRVIASPHFIDRITSRTAEEVLQAKAILEKRLEEESIDLEILLGNEIYFSDDILSDIEKGYALKLNNTRYILIEFPSTDIPNYTEDIIFSLQLKGYIPVIAHPERNTKIIRNPNILYELVERGVLAQLNLHSLVGLYGRKTMELSKVLINNNLIHFVATDCHSDGRRSPDVKKALKKLLRIADREVYNRIVYRNPESLIQNKIVTSEQAIFVEIKEGLGSKIMSFFC